MLLSRSCSCPIVGLRNVLIWWRALNDLSAEHEVTGIVVRIEATLYRTCNIMEAILMHVLYHHGSISFLTRNRGCDGAIT